MNIELSDLLINLNPWWNNPAARPGLPSSVRRSEYESIFAQTARTDERRALVLMGPRQVGKSTLLGQVVHGLLDQGVPPRQVISIDCEEFARMLPGESVSISDVADCIDARLKAESGLPRYLLLDEIHASRKWPDHLKKLVDQERGFRVLATDSSAALLREGAVESGVGRWNNLQIDPWNFRDFERLFSGGDEEILDRRFPMAFERYLLIGGFPEHILREDFTRVWHNHRKAMELALEKDLVRILGVRKEPRLKKLFVGLIRDSGRIFNASNYAKHLGDVSRQKVQEWVEHLEDMGLMHPLRRHAKSVSKETRSHPRIFAADHALVYAFSLSAAPEKDPSAKARVVETAFFRQLRSAATERDARLTFYRDENRKETDFVWEDERGMVSMEVTSSREADQDKVATTAAIAGILKSRRALVVSMISEAKTHSVGGREVMEIPMPLFFRAASTPGRDKELTKWLGL